MKVSKLSISPDGLVQIKFSKPFTLKPKANSLSSNTRQLALENTGSSETEIIIEDLVHLKIEDQDDGLDKSIAKVEVVEIGETYLTL